MRKTTCTANGFHYLVIIAKSDVIAFHTEQQNAVGVLRLDAFVLLEKLGLLNLCVLGLARLDLAHRLGGGGFLLGLQCARLVPCLRLRLP